MKKMMKWITLAAASVLTCVAFVACAPSSLKKAEKKMSDEFYNTEIETDADDVKNCEGYLHAWQPGLLGSEEIYAYLFDSKKDAESFLNANKADLQAWAAEEDFIGPRQEGKWVLIGTEDAIEDFLD